MATNKNIFAMSIVITLALSGLFGPAVSGAAGSAVLYSREVSYFIGEPGGSWSVAENWSLGYVPDGDTDAFIPEGGHAVIDDGASARSVTIESGGSLTVGFTSLVTNDALLVEGGGSLTLEAGSLVLPGGGLTVSDGGTLYGSAIVLGDVANYGLISLGQPLGTLTVIGSYTQFDTGELLIELAEQLQCDVLDVGDMVTLDGTLTIELLDPYEGWPEDVFDVVRFGSVVGEFATIAEPDTHQCVQLSIDSTDTSIRVEVQEVMLQTAKLTADDPAQDVKFGTSVSVSGDVIVVGTPEDDDVAWAAGSAYLFDATTGELVYKLTADDAEAGDWFGYSVSVDGNTIVVGAPYDDDPDDDSGSAYVFDATSGEQLHKLTADDADSGDVFGRSVSISDGVVVVGARSDDNIGSAYVFDANTGEQLHKLRADDVVEEDYFGTSVSISGQTIVVGAYNGDAGAVLQCGAAYIFDAVTGLQLPKLTADDAAEGDYFGASVSVSGNTVVVGAYHDDDAGTNSGSAYIFDAVTGQQLVKLTADDAASGDRFGRSVCVSGNTAIIGAGDDDDAGAESGSAYLFDAVTGEQLLKLTADDAAAGDEFGSSVAINANTVVAGVPEDDDAASGSGSAYVFDVSAGADCNNNGMADLCDIYFGYSEDLNENGVPDECEELPGQWCGNGGYWEDAGNWCGGYVPDEYTHVIIKDGGHPVIGQAGAVALSVTIEYGGSLTLEPGTDLTLSEGVTIDGGGALHGSGIIYADVFNYGLVSPGLSVGTLQIVGNYTQYDTGELLIELAELSEHDLLDVTDYATTLDGTLTVELVDPYGGWPDDAFDVAQFGSVVGDFATIDLPVLHECLLLTAEVLADAVHLEFEAASSDPQEIVKLLASDAEGGDGLGYAAAICGDIAVIGALGSDDNGLDSGSAYVFRYDGAVWVEEAKLLASDGAEDDNFGYSVSISGEVAVIGSPYDYDNDANSGSAYVYRYDGADWVEEAKLLASDGAQDDWFGYSVSISGEVAVIGSIYDDDNGTESGSAYVYRYDGTSWLEEAILLASDGIASDHFGDSVSISGDTAVIGADGNDDNGTSSGSAYVFRYDGANWVEEARLLASDGAAYDNFGDQVSIYGNIAVIGAYGNDDNGSFSGSAYVFRRNGALWVEEARLLASDGAASDHFGCSVSIWDGIALIGAGGNDDHGSVSGSAYMFDLMAAADCNDNDIPDACDIYFGYSEDLNENGIPDECDGQWVGGDGYWDEAENWYGGQVPDENTDVIILGGGNVLIGASGAVARSVTIEYGGSLTLEPDTSLTVLQSIVIEDGGSLTLLPGSDLIVGTGLFIQSGGALYGEGTVWGDVFNYGLISPGLSVGTLRIIGDYRQYSTGQLLIELAEQLEHDLLDVTNHHADLGGTLTVELISPYEGLPDDSFDVMLFGSVEDEFDAAELPELNECLELVPEVLADVLSLEFLPVVTIIEVEQIAKLLADDGLASDYFGYSVCISGDATVVGAYQDDEAGYDSGSAYVYRYDGSNWAPEGKLVPADGSSFDYFGISVSVSGDVAVIGASGDDDNGTWSGSAYVFRFDGYNWVQEAKLLAADGGDNDHFGYSVSVSGDIAVVGARWNDNENGTDAGAAYVFHYDGSGWEPQAKLTADDGQDNDYFGYSVSVSGDCAVVGAYGNDSNGPSSGSAYVFRFDGGNWVQEAKLLPAVGVDYGHFGYTVCVSDNTVVVGAKWDCESSWRAGSAHVYRHDGTDWLEEAKLMAADAESEDYFGTSVTISGDTVVIGAPGDDDTGGNSGSAYVFRYSGWAWIEEAKLSADDGAADDWFGHSVSVSGDNAVIGGYGHDGNGYNSGAAYLYAGLSGRDCNDNGIPDSCDIYFGFSEDLDGNGIPDECDGQWVGGDGYWDDPENWAGGYVPDENTDVTIPEYGVVVIRLPGAVARSLTIESGGSLTLEPGTDLTVSENLTIENGGTLTLEAGSVVTVGAGLTILEGGGLYGSGTINGDVFNYGLVSPGHSAGTLTIVGDYTQYGTAELLIELAGQPVCDLLDVTDYAATLDGTLTVELIASYEPAIGDSFDILEFAGLVGNFAVVNGPVLEECLSLGVHVETSSMRLEFEYGWASKRLAFDGAAGDWFGRSVSISSDVAIAGAAGDDDQGSGSGSAYISRYEGSEWLHEAKLLASDGAEDDSFGQAVSASDDLVIVGAYMDDDSGQDSGSAYIYRYDGSGWQEETKLLASDGAMGDRFGISVSINGEIAVVGAPLNDQNGEDSGAAYVYRYDGSVWQEESKLTAWDGAAGDRFGASVSIDGDVAVVGAALNDENGEDSGAAYVYRYTGSAWQEEGKLLASDGAASDWFGISVSVSSDAAVVGAYGDDDQGEQSGSSYIYRYDGSMWQEEHKLLAPDGADYDSYGYSVSIDGDQVVVGADGYDGGSADDVGAAFVYQHDGSQWTVGRMLLAPDGETDDLFGYSVAISGEQAMAGAYGDGDNGGNAGSAYIFDILITEDCQPNGAPDQCDLYFGHSEDVNLNGIPDECECPADLDGSDVVDIDDLFIVLAYWGPCPDPCPPYCIGDINWDCVVDIDDLFEVLAAWGPCM